MKKTVAVLLVLVLSMGLVSCTKLPAPNIEVPEYTAEAQPETQPETPAPATAKPGKQPSEPQPLALPGKWECTAMRFDGEEEFTDAKTLLDEYGLDVSAMYSVYAWENGNATLNIAGAEGETDSLPFTWKQDGEKLEFSIPEEIAAELDESLAGAMDNDTLILTMTSTYLSDGEKVQSEESMKFKHIGDAPADILGFSVNFSEADTLKMGSWQNRGLGIVVDDTLYAREVYGTLACSKLVKDGGDVEYEDIQVIYNDKNCRPGRLQAHDGYVYGIFNVYESSNSDIMNGIFRVDTATKELELLYDGFAAYMCVAEDGLYFCDENYHYVKIPLDGSSAPQPVIADKEVYYPYLLGNGWLLYQDDADGERLHLMELKSGYDVAVTDERSYDPIIAGNAIYYCSMAPGAERGCLARLDLATWEIEKSENIQIIHKFMIDDDRLYVDTDTQGKLTEWKTFLRDHPDEECVNPLAYSDGEYTLNYSYDEDFRINGIYCYQWFGRTQPAVVGASNFYVE